MNSKIYEFVDMPNGIKMMSILPINQTGIAEAYCSVRDNPQGHSTGHCGKLSCNIYKPLDLQNGIRDWEMCCEALGVSPRQVITNRLTAITNKVRVVDEQTLVGYDILDEPAAPRADGLITNSPNVTLFHYAADCAICMFLDPVTRTTGILHASWRGSLLGIFEAEVQKFKTEFGADVRNIIAVLLPSISVDYFEVGNECAEQFEHAGLGEFVDYTTYAKPHVNLPKVNTRLLLNCGLLPNHVYTVDDLCTYRDERLFHSFRRGPIAPNGVHLNGMNGYFIKLK